MVGRGICDMKGFLAIAAAFVPEFARRQLTTPIHLAMSFDGEVEFLGVPLLLHDLKERGLATPGLHRRRAVGNGPDPRPQGQDRRPCDGDGRRCAFRRGACRSERGGSGRRGDRMPEGHSAPVDKGPFNPALEPQYTTIQTCMVGGGTAVNIVAARCTFSISTSAICPANPMDYVDECRAFVETRIEPEMKAAHPGGGNSTTGSSCRAVPP